MYDIAIIGLGPAGATLARMLDKKYKVIVLDNKNEKRSKCCGGLLSPDAQKILASFDLCLPKDVLVNPQIFSVKTIDLSNDIVRDYQRFYLNMDRGKFDRWLISLIPNSVEILNEAICRSVEKVDNYYEIEFEKDGKIDKKQAKVVVGADGANSIVRNKFCKSKKINRYVSIQEWYQNEEKSPIYTAIFDNELTDSYCWTISKDDYFIIGGAFPEDKCNERFESLKDKLKDRGYKFSKEKLKKREGCFVYLANKLNCVYTGKGNHYLIGEAAGLISSSSLEGISYAMQSGYILAKVLNKKMLDSNRLYMIETLKMRAKLKIKIFKRPFMYNKILRNMVMKSGIKTIKKS